MTAADRARLLAAGVTRTGTERVADALARLTTVIEAERDDAERLRHWGAALGFINSRTRSEFARTTGQQP